MAPSVAPASPLYPALRDTQPAVRAKQLTVALHWDRSLPEGAGKPISLADCMLREAGGDRRATIEAYWLVRQRAAEYQVLVQQSEMLEALMPVVLERRSQPSGPAEMLRLHAAQTAAQAATREAQVALLEAQYALAQRIGAMADAAWPLASTVPHSGSYLLKLDAQPARLGRVVAGAASGSDDSGPGRERPAVRRGRGRGRRHPRRRRRKVPHGRSPLRSSLGGSDAADGANPGILGHTDRVQSGDRRVRGDGAAADNADRQARGRVGGQAVTVERNSFRSTAVVPRQEPQSRRYSTQGRDCRLRGFMTPQALHIGTLLIDPPVLQAPMAGFTNYAYRQIVRRLGGVGLPATEMVSARGFLHIDARSGEFPDRLWGVRDEPRPLAVQIWDNDPASLAAVGERLAEEFRVSLVDINFGCPVRDVSREGPERFVSACAIPIGWADRRPRGGRLPAGAGDGQDPPGLHARHDQRHRRGPGGRRRPAARR